MKEPTEICRDCVVMQGEDCVTLCELHAAAGDLLELLRVVLKRGITEQLVEKAESVIASIEE